MKSLIPERLETTRLVLRTLREDDWVRLHEHYSDPICTRYTFGHALTEGESWRAMASMAGHWVLRGYGPYGVEERASGDLLGVVGLWYPNDWPGPEIKWALIRRHWGNGFASEAARAVREMAKDVLPTASLISFIHSENSPSIRIAVAVGGAWERDVEFRGGKWQVYRY
jgi:RimJ/RimL family protein N-acetyltransferase